MTRATVPHTVPPFSLVAVGELDTEVGRIATLVALDAYGRVWRYDFDADGWDLFGNRDLTRIVMEKE